MRVSVGIWLAVAVALAAAAVAVLIAIVTVPARAQELSHPDAARADAAQLAAIKVIGNKRVDADTKKIDRNPTRLRP